MKTTEKKQFLKTLGEWVRKLRTMRGLGQDQLTEQSGLSKGVISKIENGKVDPRSTTLLRLARALRFPLRKIWEGVEKPGTLA